MHWSRYRANFPKGAVVAIGNFDGVHLGHQAIVERLKRESANLGVPAVVLTFAPSPRHYFGDTTCQLISASQKLKYLSHLGVEHVWLLPFRDSLAKMSAAAFIDCLQTQLSCRGVVVGPDFRFGAARQGRVEDLRQAGLPVWSPEVVMYDGQVVSSSRIRTALASGSLSVAQACLGRPYQLSGRVGYGDQRGRQLGFPTANITIPFVSALRGVYAVRVRIAGDEHWHQGVANIGNRPTFCGKRRLLEVHLLDVDQNLYGKRLEVAFEKHIRGEKKFSGVEALVRQITKDVRLARAILGEAECVRM